MIARWPFASLLAALIAASALASGAAAADGAADTETVAEPESFDLDDLPKSLMFSAKAISRLERLFGLDPKDMFDIERQAGLDLYLSSLVFFSPRDWTVWINGRRLTPDSPTLDFRIMRVSPDFVELVMAEPAGRYVRLHPNQTYRRDTNSVVDGSTAEIRSFVEEWRREEQRRRNQPR